jgi:hypothetical protein
MSELKVYRDQEDYIAYDDYALEKAYDKFEADRYIGELKKERDWLAKDRAQAYDDLEKRAQLNIKQEESIRHQKYRRCMAMAKWCDSENYTACWYHENSERCKWTEKWHKRWLNIAEQFKEAK